MRSDSFVAAQQSLAANGAIACSQIVLFLQLEC
jgi:hypothetical protein